MKDMKHTSIKKPILSLLYIILAAFSVSCIEDFNPDLGEADSNILVINGNICSDTVCYFNLSRSFGINDNVFNDPDKLRINNAKIKITGTDGSEWMGYNVAKGEYRVKTGKLKSDVMYSLEVELGDVTFTSEPAYPLDSPEIEEAMCAQPRADMIVDVMVTDAPATDETPHYYRWTYEETWEVQAYYQAYFEYNPKYDKIFPITVYKGRGWQYAKYTSIIIANSSNFENNRIKNFRINKISNSDLRMQTLYCCDIKQYAMTQAQYEYEQARLELSDNMGGMFAPQPSELATNIKASDKNHRAIGYVGVYGKVGTYRLWISRSDVEYDNIFYKNVKTLSEGDEDFALTDADKYKKGYRVNDTYEPFMSPWHWSPAFTVDVTTFGASLERPDFWPN